MLVHRALKHRTGLLLSQVPPSMLKLLREPRWILDKPLAPSYIKSVVARGMSLQRACRQPKGNTVVAMAQLWLS